MQLSLEKYTSVTAWNYADLKEKGVLTVCGTCWAASLNLTPDEMESLAFELQTAARVCRERAAEEVNAANNVTA